MGWVKLSTPPPHNPIRQQGKSWQLTLFLSAFLGPLGIDRFYLGKVGTGILKLLTVGGFGLWWLTDFILVAAYDVRDSKGYSLQRARPTKMRALIAGAGFIFLAAVLVLGLSSLFFQSFKGSDAYVLATKYASEHELVKAEIGAVTGFGLIPMGSISTSGDSGEASLSITVIGEKGKGRLYIDLVKILGEWSVVDAGFKSASGVAYDLVSHTVGTGAERHTNLGSSHLTQGRIQEGIAEFDEAIRLDPQYARAYYNRGIAYGDLGEFERTITNLDEAIRLDPQYASAYYTRGTAYGILGQLRKAKANRDIACKLDKEYCDS